MLRACQAAVAAGQHGSHFRVIEWQEPSDLRQQPADVADAEERSVALLKGANVGLRQLDAELGSVSIMLEWGVSEGQTPDADVSVLLIGADGRVRSNDDLIFYNQPTGADGAVQLRGKLETQDNDGLPVTTDAVTIDLDDLPDSVAKVVLAARLDATPEVAGFGALRTLRLRLLRASDARQLLHFDITDATSEAALLFGELYRRADEWKFRAIGQGYDSGFAGLVTEFGIEVDDPSDAEASQTTEPAAEVADATNPDISVDTTDPLAAPELTVDLERTGTPPRTETPTRTPGRVNVGKPRAGAPRMPAERRRRRSVPTYGEPDWEPARLFPVAGIGAGEEQERRATSAFLAVVATVKEFGRAVTSQLGAPAGAIETFIEVPFSLGENTYQPDGVIRVCRGKRTWTALLEVKTSDAELRKEQIETYVEIARERGFDAVISLSNQISELVGGHPVTVDARKLKKVKLHHLSWDEIRTEAILLTEHRVVGDNTQAHVLREFVRYLEHPRSGAQGFNDMRSHWVRVRESSKAGTLRASDKGAAQVAARFEQLFRYGGMHLAALLGTEVGPANRTVGSRVSALTEQMVATGTVDGALRVPGTVGPIDITIDLRAERISASVLLDAPKEGRALTRVNWLLRQLKEAPGGIRIEALLSNARGDSTAELLKDLRNKPELLLPPAGRDIRAYRISLDAPMGSKRGVGRGSLITSTLDLLVQFYGDVVQNLRAWTAKPPKLPEQESADA